MNKTFLAFILFITLLQNIYTDPDPEPSTTCLSKNQDNTMTEEGCNVLTTSSNKKKCVLVTDVGCDEVDMECEDKKTGADNEFCVELKTVKEGMNACVASEGKCIETNECGLVLVGCTDDLIIKLTPKDQNSVCINDKGVCKEIKKCNYAEGNSDDECKNFPVETKDATCKKDNDADGKCKEFLPSTNEKPADNKDEETKIGEETKNDEKEETKKGEETKKNETNNSQSTTNTQSTNTTQAKASGNGVNGLKFSLVIVILLFLF